VHCTSEEDLFSQVCRAAVQSGGMKLAWVGLIDTQTLMVRPAASFGDGADDLGNIEISADAESPFGNGPTGIAIRENRPFWCQDFPNAPETAPWHERGARSGCAAAAALPLHRNGVVIGAFILDSDKTNSFDEPARDLLVEMAGDISFALDSFVHESQRRHAADEIERPAFYDPLTNLPNRRLLHDRLRYALAASARHHNHGAVLFIDLDDFKTLNDTKGHNIGDLLLIEVASRLQACMREKDTVARIGSIELAGDHSMQPLRGALIRVLNDGSTMPQIAAAHCVAHDDKAADQKMIYIIPRGLDHLILGGITELGEWNTNIGLGNYAPIRDILQRCQEFLPILKSAVIDELDSVRVGLRPYRQKNVRLERESPYRIFHNYGHGGSGFTFSWGCAKEVVTLIKSMREAETTP
jgi:GAF domain-containing protein